MAQVVRLHRRAARQALDWSEIEDLDVNPATQGRNWTGTYGVRGTADRMRLDSIVSAAMTFVVSFAAGVRWHFVPGDGSPEAAESAKLHNDLWLRRYPFATFVRQAVHAIYSSFGFHELTERPIAISQTEYPLHRGRGIAYGPKKLYSIPARAVAEIHASPRDPSTIGHIVEETGTESVEISARHLIYWGWDVEAPMFRANPVLRRQYGPFFVKRLANEIWAAKTNRFGMPVPVVERPNPLGGAFSVDPNEEQGIAKSLSEWESDPNSYLTLPFGYRLNLVQSDFDQGMERVIEAANRDLWLASGAGHMWLGQSSGAQVGSHALAQTQGAEARVSLDCYPMAIEEALNHGFNFSIQEPAIARTHRLNYGPDVAPPRLEAFDTPSAKWQSVLPMLFEAIKAQAVIPSEEISRFVLMVLRVSETNPDVGQTAEFRDMSAELIQGLKEQKKS